MLACRLCSPSVARGWLRSAGLRLHFLKLLFFFAALCLALCLLFFFTVMQWLRSVNPAYKRMRLLQRCKWSTTQMYLTSLVLNCVPKWDGFLHTSKFLSGTNVCATSQSHLLRTAYCLRCKISSLTVKHLVTIGIFSLQTSMQTKCSFKQGM